MDTPQTRRFDARLEALEEMRGFVEGWCAQMGVDPRAIAMLMLICEELFENSRRHGYPAAPGGAFGRPVWLTLAATSEDIAAVYEDAAPAYNPFASVSMPDYSAPPETWREGGLGIPLITRLTRELRYEHTGERNRISFRVPANGAAA